MQEEECILLAGPFKLCRAQARPREERPVGPGPARLSSVALRDRLGSLQPLDTGSSSF